MNLDGTEAILTLIAAAGGHVEGSKKLHKLVYLANKKGFKTGHGFRYHYFGVFSPALEHDLGVAVNTEALNRSSDGPDTRNDFALPDGNNICVDDENPGLALVKELAGEEARTLEVLSTIVYLDSIGLESDGLKRKLKELKGHIDTSYHNRAWQLYDRCFQPA